MSHKCDASIDELMVIREGGSGAQHGRAGAVASRGDNGDDDDASSVRSHAPRRSRRGRRFHREDDQSIRSAPTTIHRGRRRDRDPAAIPQRQSTADDPTTLTPLAAAAKIADASVLVVLLLLLASVSNLSNVQRALRRATQSEGRSTLFATSEEKRARDSVPFRMCDRETPFRYEINPRLPPAERRAIFDEPIDWPRDNKLLLLRNDGKFGHVGNQVNSLLHAFDYARDHKMDLGILFHSWAMDAIQTMFYETDDFDVLGRELWEDLGIIVVRNQTQLERYDEVVSQNSQQLYFYKSSNAGMDHWKETMRVHIAILQRLFLRYNRGYGYVHNGLRAQDVCAALDMFFHRRPAEARYTVVHSRYLDGNAEWKLERIARTTGLTIEGGAMYMGPAYVKSILRPLGMLDSPVILLTDGQLPSVERGLFNDPVIGPNLMVLSEKEALTEADIALAILSDVFIGNPASVTSGFIARARVALGYPEKSTQLFRRKRIHQWYSVCNQACVFNPWIMNQWV